MATENQNAEKLADAEELREKNGGDPAEDTELLKRQILALKAKLKEKDDEIRRVKVNAAVDAELAAAGARNVKAAKALISGIDKMEIAEDGSVIGLEEKINAIKVSDGYLFEQRTGNTVIRGAKPAESGYDGVDGNTDVSKMTYSQLAEFIRKNPAAKVFD